MRLHQIIGFLAGLDAIQGEDGSRQGYQQTYLPSDLDFPSGQNK